MASEVATASARPSADKSETRSARNDASEPGRRDGLRYLRRLFVRYLPGERRLLGLAFVMLALEAGAAVAEAWPIARLIDVIKGDKPRITVLGTSESATVLFLAMVIIALAVITTLCDSAAEILLARAGRTFGFNIRNELFGRLQRLSLAFHDRRRTGDVLARVTSDVDAVEDFVIGSVSDIIGSVLTLAFTIAVLNTKSLPLVLTALVIVPLLIVVSRLFSASIRSAAKRFRSIEGEVASSTQEMLGSIRVIQTYGRAGYEERRFQELNTQRLGAGMRSAVLQAQFSGVVSVLEALVVCAVVWQGSRMVAWNGAAAKSLSVGDLVFAVALIQGMFKPTRRVIKEWTTVGKVLASSERIGELLDRRPSVTDRPDAIEATVVRGDIRLDHVWFTYTADPGQRGDAIEQAARPVLEDVSIHVPPGKVYALIGHTGAGKSTILQLLPRLYDVSGGSVSIDGHDVRNLTIDSLRANISVVLQETVLFSGTVAENIAYGRMDATPEEIEAAARQANAHEFITRLPDGYDTALGERGANLSGGQRQRIAIARAYVRRAPILLLDEPTTGLDVESSTVVLDALRTLMRDTTTIIVSHDLKLIEHADQIVVLRLGRVEQQGTHESLLAEGGVYARLHGLATEPEHEPAGDDESDQLDVARWTANSRQFFDQSLPALAVAFDGDAMGRRLVDAMIDRRYVLHECKPGKAAYLPDGSCTLRYDIRLSQRAASTESFGAIVMARVFARPELAHFERVARVDELGIQARGHALLRPFRQPIAVFDDLGMLASAFPIDPELPELVPTTDGRVMRGLLGQAMNDEDFSVVDVRSHPGHLNLGRQHRCVVRYDVQGHDASGVAQRRVLYGKVADDDRGERTVAALEGLWASRYAVPRWHDIRLPAVVLHRRDLGVLILSEVTGAPNLARSISAMVRGTSRPTGAPGALDGVRHSARVAALIHSTPTELSAEKTIDGSVDELLDLLTVLSPMSESLATWLVDAVDIARRDLAAGTPGPLALAHGDFTHTQLLFDSGSIALIDFDTVCSAEAAVDLGHYMGYLRLVVAKAANGESSNDLADALCANFLDTYFAERPDLSTSAVEQLRRRAAAYELVSLVRIAGHGWYKLKNERLFHSVSLVRDAVQRVTGHDPGLPVSERVHV